MRLAKSFCVLMSLLEKTMKKNGKHKITTHCISMYPQGFQVKQKSQKKEEISDVLSQLEKNSADIQIVHTLKSFQDLLNATERITRPSTKSDYSKEMQPWDVPYANSLSHFFLYYMHPPNYPFILRIHNVLWFAAFTGNHYNNLMISSPINTTSSELMRTLHLLLNDSLFLSLLKKIPVKTILLRSIDNKMINLLRKETSVGSYHLRNIKQIHYNTYDIKKTLSLQGASFANLRWHLNMFKKASHTIKVVPIHEVEKPVLHLIGKWRKDAILKRGFSFVDTQSDKQGINLAIQKTSLTTTHKKSNNLISADTVISRVLQVDGTIASFNLGYPLGIFQSQPVFAHAIGIADISIPHLAEYAQIDFWSQVEQQGYHYINDGPSWRNSLEVFKNKFRPITKKDYYWATLTMQT
jgi:hypothetical protein